MATNKSKVLKYFKVDNVEKTKLVCRVSVVSSVALGSNILIAAHV